MARSMPRNTAPGVLMVELMRSLAVRRSAVGVLLLPGKSMRLPPTVSQVRVIGHGIGGKVSQLKWRDSLKVSRWSKRRRSVLVTQSHSQSTSDGSEDPLVTLTPHIIGDSLRRISTTSLIEVA